MPTMEERYGSSNAVNASLGFHCKLRRSSDLVFETSQTEVEYVSPEQHGGFFGTVYRQYHSQKLHGSSISVPGLTQVIAFAGRWNTINCYNGYMESGASVVRILKGTDQIDFVVLNITNGCDDGWIDYTR